MSRRAPQEGRSYEQALYSVVLLVPRLPRPERTGTVRVLLDFIADLWELDRSRVDADFASLVRGLPRCRPHGYAHARPHICAFAHAHTRTDTHIRGRAAARPP